MKKILPLLVVSILVLSGLEVGALLEDKESINKLDEEYEIVIKGELLGYTVTTINTGDEPFDGHFEISIRTNASIWMIEKNTVSNFHPYFMLDPNQSVKQFLYPVIGFGRAIITIEGFICNYLTGGNYYRFEIEENGFVFFIFILCGVVTIHLP